MKQKTSPRIVLTENVICKNCNTQFNGYFCPACGQGVRDLDRPFGFIIINFAGDLFAFDSRFFKTVKALFLKPGYLSEQFFKGKRAQYATPTRLYILSSFILFFLLQIYSNRMLTNVLDAPVIYEKKELADSASVAFSDPFLAGISSVPDSAIIGITGISSSIEVVFNKRNIREGLMELSDQMAEVLQKEEDPKEKAKLQEQIRLMRSPEQAIAKILKYMSWAFFLLLPLFALILKLFYFRRKYYFIRHLVFSIYLHTFIFFIYILLISLHFLFEKVSDLINLTLLFTVVLYFILALKRFYGQSIFKVILKFTGISLIYNLLFWFIVGGVFLRSLNII